MDSWPSTSAETPAETETAGNGIDHAEEAMTDLTFFDRMYDEDFDGTGLWIFGYGSLCWNQGFNYDKSFTGYIRGFSRRFWQGNTTHRGTEKKPGRVATLIEEEEGIVWGQAYQVKEKETFAYLNNRECELGGYLTAISTFYPRQPEKIVKPFPVIVYLATPSNRHWLGDSSLEDMADQIVECSGNSGHNVEYLLKLAEFMRDNVPEAVDEHLFALEDLVRGKIAERNLCLDTLMGEKKASKFQESLVVPLLDFAVQMEPEVVVDGRDGRTGRRDLLQFTSTVPTKKLRCVNIC